MSLKLIALFISFISLHNIQQKQEPAQVNNVSFKQIAVVNSAKKSFSMGSRAQLEKAFGRIKVKKDTDEMAGRPAYIYDYKGLEVFFSGTHCESMKIKGASYQMVVNGTSYSVGDAVTKLQTAFPLSYKNRKEGNVILWVKGSETSLSFTYNTKGTITGIEVANNNS